jgi:hypothetical protein
MTSLPARMHVMVRAMCHGRASCNAIAAFGQAAGRGFIRCGAGLALADDWHGQRAGMMLTFYNDINERMREMTRERIEILSGPAGESLSWPPCR